MITIIDGSETLRGETVRKLLIKSGFPCNLCNPNEFINSLDAVISFKLSDCKSVMDEELIILADGKAFGGSQKGGSPRSAALLHRHLGQEAVRLRGGAGL